MRGFPPLAVLSEAHVPFVTIGKSCAIRSRPPSSSSRRNAITARLLAFGAVLASVVGKFRLARGYKLKPRPDRHVRH
ncbi:hypothetical protein BCAR13_1710003 [Paraburkholderia caribensis]|nr:hypothetical protein BCAR13_1710003 [Paraburkholderia caribensis]